MISYGWVIIIMLAEGILGEALCVWVRSWRHARNVIGLTEDEGKARQVALWERLALTELARRPYPPWVHQHGREIADDLRSTFPSLSDAQLIRVALRARWIIGTQHASGRNCVQISHLFAAAALELAAIDVDLHGQAAR